MVSCNLYINLNDDHELRHVAITMSPVDVSLLSLGCQLWPPVA